MFTIASDNSRPTNNPVYALLIGVSNYEAYDASGALNLPGATHDANIWQAYCENTLGLGESNLQKLTDDSGTEATSRQSIIEALKWLGQQLGKQETINGASALLTFSGHGLTLEGVGSDNIAEGLSLALAPSDIDKGLSQALLFSHIEEILFNAVVHTRFDTTTPSDEQRQEAYAILQNVTAVFDACYSRPDASKKAVRSLTVGSKAPTLPELKVFSRLILGAHLWETAYEIQTCSMWHGAFTYAFVTMLEQWRVQSDAQTPVYYSRAAYGDLVYRTRSLISTLGMPDQTPTLLGSQNNLALVPFLRPGKEINPEWTSVMPDGPREREEFSSDNDDQIWINFIWGVNGTTWTIASLYVAQNQTSETWTFYPNIIQNFMSYTNGTIGHGPKVGGGLFIDFSTAGPIAPLQDNNPVNNLGTPLPSQADSTSWEPVTAGTQVPTSGANTQYGITDVGVRYGTTQGDQQFGIYFQWAYNKSSSTYVMTNITAAANNIQTGDFIQLVSTSSGEIDMGALFTTYPAGWSNIVVYNTPSPSAS